MATLDKWVSGLTMVGVIMFAVFNWRSVNELVGGLARSATAYVSGIATAGR